MDKRLLIIGAGGHGQVVKETAEAMNQFEKIDFLDDHSNLAVGRFDEYDKLQNKYTYAFIALGSNELRSKWHKNLESTKYIIPILVHPNAYVSPSVEIKKGTIILAKAVVNTNSRIGQGTIIGIGALIDHDVTIKQFCHINSGAIIKAGCTVDNYTKIDVGNVYSGSKPNQEYRFEAGV